MSNRKAWSAQTIALAAAGGGA